MTSASELRSGKTHRDENFPVASWIIHPRHRALILAFYNFVRTADDIADHAKLGAEEKLRLLDLLEAELLGRGDTQPEAVKLRHALAERSMPPRHALDVLIAFRMDVTKLRYENWDEVIHYCRYSVIQAFADKIVSMLKVRDPLNERVHLNPLELVAYSIGGILSETARRASGRRPVSKPAAGA